MKDPLTERAPVKASALTAEKLTQIHELHEPDTKNGPTECSWCGGDWPCDAAILLAEVDRLSARLGPPPGHVTVVFNEDGTSTAYPSRDGQECGWPWWDPFDGISHHCTLPVGHDDGLHEPPPPRGRGKPAYP